MTLNEWIESRRGVERVEVSPGVWVGVRRLTAAEFLAIAGRGDDAGAAMILAAAANAAAVANPAPLFTTIDEVKRLPVAVFFPMLRACQSVNVLDVESAGKN